MISNVPYETIEKWRTLVDRLVSLTDKNKIVWQETANDDEFVSGYNNLAITVRKIKKNVQGEPTPFVVIELAGSGGKVIDSFDDEDISEPNDAEGYYPKMNNLLQTIARRVSGADEELDSLLKAMAADDGDIPF